jgi:excisionase family DNA binding protein
MTVKEAAQRLELPLSTTYELISSGKLRARRFDGPTGKAIIRVPDEAVAEFIRQAEMRAIQDTEEQGEIILKHLTLE